jgi:hypothetical protein
MTGVGVVLDPGRLIGPAESDQVRADNAMSGRRNDWNHPSVRKRPRRLTMQHQHRITFGGAVFHPRHP